MEYFVDDVSAVLYFYRFMKNESLNKFLITLKFIVIIIFFIYFDIIKIV